jgi:hypothetical protein
MNVHEGARISMNVHDYKYEFACMDLHLFSCTYMPCKCMHVRMYASCDVSTYVCKHACMHLFANVMCILAHVFACMHVFA